MIVPFKVKSHFLSQDSLGNSALHYATMFWPEEVVGRLLKLGANVGTVNLQVELSILATIEKFVKDVKSAG